MDNTTSTAASCSEKSEGSINPRKRKQILDGARRVFLSHGFDAASVNELALEAGVSKATLYAYFPSKEQLFETLVFEDRRQQAERVFEFNPAHEPVDVVLRQIGLRLCTAVCRPEAIAYTRVVIAAATKFPEVGRAFYEAGPAYANAMIASFLRTRCETGEIAIADPEMAANQFADLCLSGIVKPLMFAIGQIPSESVLTQRVDEAVAMMMARYRVRHS